MFDAIHAVFLGLIPWFKIPDGHLGPIPIHPFGLLVATGIIVGHKIATKRAQVLGLDENEFERLVFWTVFTGIVLSHMLDTIFYHPQTLLSDPVELFKIWNGLSSFGGFFGAGIGFYVYTRRNPIDPWRSADAIAYGLPTAWLFGRSGCSSVHDHPGRLTDSVIALNFPGGPRFDLGMMELALTPLIVAVVLAVGARTKRRGKVIGALCVSYPFIRFPLDFLRATDAEGGDVRYLGFTPGQYACLLCFSIGAFILYATRNLPELPDAPAAKAEPAADAVPAPKRARSRAPKA